LVAQVTLSACLRRHCEGPPHRQRTGRLRQPLLSLSRYVGWPGYFTLGRRLAPPAFKTWDLPGSPSSGCYPGRLGFDIADPTRFCTIGCYSESRAPHIMTHPEGCHKRGQVLRAVQGFMVISQAPWCLGSDAYQTPLWQPPLHKGVATTNQKIRDSDVLMERVYSWPSP